MSTTCTVDSDSLIEVWKVLEMLTVSLDRLGEYERDCGQESARNALDTFMGPPMFHRIAHARSIMVSILEQCDPAMMDRLELMAEDEDEIGYWDGPE
jgi:hypothetical protein